MRDRGFNFVMIDYDLACHTPSWAGKSGGAQDLLPCFGYSHSRMMPCFRISRVGLCVSHYCYSICYHRNCDMAGLCFIRFDAIYVHLPPSPTVKIIPVTCLFEHQNLASPPRLSHTTNPLCKNLQALQNLTTLYPKPLQS